MSDLYYDNSSPNGNIICGMYELHDNIMNPENPVGYFLYILWGGVFDDIQENWNQELQNMSPVRCDPSYLDLFAKEYNLKRDSEWSDDEYRAIILLNKYGINSIAGFEYYLNMLNQFDVDNNNEKVRVEFLETGFLVSDENTEHEVVSSSEEDKDLLVENKVQIIVKAPKNFNVSLLEFIQQFLPYDFIVNGV
nr:hypothetical protein [Methanobrevibacter arboriphilus]